VVAGISWDTLKFRKKLHKRRFSVPLVGNGLFNRDLVNASGLDEWDKAGGPIYHLASGVASVLREWSCVLDLLKLRVLHSGTWLKRGPDYNPAALTVLRAVLKGTELPIDILLAVLRRSLKVNTSGTAFNTLKGVNSFIEWRGGWH